MKELEADSLAARDTKGAQGQGRPHISDISAAGKQMRGGKSAILYAHTIKYMAATAVLPYGPAGLLPR